MSKGNLFWEASTATEGENGYFEEWFDAYWALSNSLYDAAELVTGDAKQELLDAKRQLDDVVTEPGVFRATAAGRTWELKAIPADHDREELDADLAEQRLSALASSVVERRVVELQIGGGGPSDSFYVTYDQSGFVTDVEYGWTWGSDEIRIPLKQQQRDLIERFAEAAKTRSSTD